MHLQLDPHQTYLLAISGGGDSMALAHMARAQNLQVAWGHVLHNWNPEETETAAFVAAQAKAYGVQLYTHTGSGKAQTNAEAHARAERMAFFASLCATHGYAGVVLAHTQTDVAETFLMRAGKGSGVEGLAAMAPISRPQGVTLYRPLLQVSREDLRAYLRQNNQPWREDTENLKAQNQRAKIRALLPALEAAGVPVHGLAASAQALARANAALTPPALPEGEEGVPLGALLAQPQEFALRQVAGLLKRYMPHQLPPRTGKRVALLKAMQAAPQGTATLGGLVWRWRNGWLRVWPESRKS